MIISDLTKLGKSKYSAIGLDIGATSIKMVQLQSTSKGWAIRDMLIKEIAAVNKENGGSRRDAIVRTITDGIAESSFSGRSVVAVMPGYQLDIFPVKVSLSGKETLEEAIIKEASAHLSYKVENAVIDYIPFENDEAGADDSRTTRSLLTAARREDVDAHLSILKEAKLKPVALDISACALARVIGLSRTDKDKNALIINAGDLHTTLTVLWKDNIILDRNILWGRENMTESLMNRLKLDRQKASGLLCRAGLHPRQFEEPGHENERNDYTNKISETVYEIIATQLEKLAKEIDKVLQYFSSEMRGAKIDVLYLMGAASTIKDLDTYLAKRIGIATKDFNPLRALDVLNKDGSKGDNGSGSFFGVALGLAVRGFEKQHIKCKGK